jgi:hypothetical protein
MGADIVIRQLFRPPGSVLTNRSRVRNSPMSRQRLARPDGANFFRSVITDCEDEIEFGAAGLRKFIPTLASETLRGQMSILKLRDGFRSNRARGTTSCIKGCEVRLSFIIHDCLRHDGAGGVARAQEKHVVVVLHVSYCEASRRARRRS